MVLAKKVLSGALALLGVALLLVGLWFVDRLGSTGAATFTTSPRGTSPVVLEPSLINRLDQPLTVRVVPADGESVWVGVGAPSDVTAAISSTPAVRLSTVSLPDWVVVQDRNGRGLPAPLADAEIWRTTSSEPGPVSFVVDQRSAPETIVVSGGVAPLRSVTLTWQHKPWFYQSLAVAVVGLLLASAGVGALWAGSRSTRARATP